MLLFREAYMEHREAREPYFSLYTMINLRTDHYNSCILLMPMLLVNSHYYHCLGKEVTGQCLKILFAVTWKQLLYYTYSPDICRLLQK